MKMTLSRQEAIRFVRLIKVVHDESMDGFPLKSPHELEWLCFALTACDAIVIQDAGVNFPGHLE